MLPKHNCTIKIPTLTILCSILLIGSAHAQETYPTKAVGQWANLGTELFNAQKGEIISRVPHLQSLDVDFGNASWHLQSTTNVAAATTSINLEIHATFSGFTMETPGGGYKNVSLSEAGIRPSGYSIVDIQAEVTFGRINARATTEIDFSGSFGEKSKGSGFIRFDSREGGDAFNTYVNDFYKKNNRYPTVSELFSGLDPTISIKYKGSFNSTILSSDASFKLNAIRKYIEKIWAEATTNNKANELVAAGRNAENSGNIDEAIEKYEESYALNKDPNTKAKIEELKTKKQNDATATRENQQQENSAGTNTPQTASSIGATTIANSSETSAQYTYDEQAWAKFNQSQQQVKNWQQDFDRQIELGEQQRKANAQAYDQIATDLATNIVNITNQMEAKKEQERINKRIREINSAVDDCYAQLRDDATYWVDFQNKLIKFGNDYKNVIPKQALEDLESAIKAIQNNLKGIDQDINELDKEVEHYWGFAEDMNDVFRFPLGIFEGRSYGKTNPGIGYNLVTIINAGTGIPIAQQRSSYSSDASGLLAEYAVDVQNYDYILSAASAYETSNGSNTRYQSLLRNAKAIKAYVDLKNTIQKEYDAFKEELKSKKGLVILKSSDSRIRFEGITPMVGQMKAANSYKQSMADLFPKINTLTTAYQELRSQIGEFNPMYANYAPSKIAQLEADGLFVEPGEVTLSLSVNYMDPSPLVVSLPVRSGESKSIDLGSYYKSFSPNKYFKPFDELNHKKERFKQKNNFKASYTVYNMGISEGSLTFYGAKRFASMRSYQNKGGAFFTNIELVRAFYGASVINSGLQDVSGDSYDKHTSDFTYFGGEVGLFGLGYVQRIFGGAMLELQGAASLFSYYSFAVDATTQKQFGATQESASGNYTLDIANYAVLHGIAELRIPMGRRAINMQYRYNFYPLVELQNEIGDKGDISELEEDYVETYTPFYKDLFNNYFTHSLTLSFNF